MNTQKPTPRTDLYCGTHETHRINGKTIYQHAEELERELAHANEEVTFYSHACDRNVELLAVAKSENEAMRAAIQGATTAFQFITSNWTERDLKPGETIRQVFHAEKITEAKFALAALKPFLSETPTK